jgi:putative transposase
MSNTRNRTPSEYVGYGLYLYFLGLSLRNVVRALSFLHIVKRSHVAVWNWIQKFRVQRMSSTGRKNIQEYIVDETSIKVGSDLVWLWVAIEPGKGQFLAQSISQERNMFVAEHFLSGIVRNYGMHPVSTDGGTWYPMACRFLKLKHHVHSLWEKGMIERKMQYLKDRTESFDNYFPCQREKCTLNHIKNWLRLFVSMHNKERINA